MSLAVGIAEISRARNLPAYPVLLGSWLHCSKKRTLCKFWGEKKEEVNNANLSGAGEKWVVFISLLEVALPLETCEVSSKPKLFFSPRFSFSFLFEPPLPSVRRVRVTPYILSIVKDDSNTVGKNASEGKEKKEKKKKGKNHLRIYPST